MAITRLWSIYLDNAAIVNRLKMAVISKLEHVCSSKKHIKSHIIAPDDEEHTLTQPKAPVYSLLDINNINETFIETCRNIY